MRVCPKCNTQIYEEQKFCSKCGIDLGTQNVFSNSYQDSTKKSNEKIFIIGALSLVSIVLVLVGAYLILSKTEKENKIINIFQPGIEQEIVSRDANQSKTNQAETNSNEIKQQEQNRYDGNSESRDGKSNEEVYYHDTSGTYDNMAYVLQLSDEASERLLSEKELYGFDTWELTILRNAIYAYHGRPFATKVIREFFEQQPWYAVNPSYSDSLLNKNELKNAVMILEYQKRSGKRGKYN